MIKAEIIADSLNIVGNRLTTFVLEYPRMVHSEFMTHRMFSKNSASSRAIPIEKFIQQIQDNPAMPEFWGKNQSGMQAYEELDDNNKTFRHDYNIKSYQLGADLVLSDKELAKKIWLVARDEAIERVKELNRLGLHKQIVNRLLEPWFHIRVICSATEYENFFALRAHRDAQPEIKILAERMLEEYNKSTPKLLQPGEWHIPFGDKIDTGRLINAITNNFDNHLEMNRIAAMLKVAIARCARVSYYNYEGKDDYEADIKLCDRLFANNPKHLSPTEHVAQALDCEQWSGNFCGFEQYRKMFKEENLTDERVLKKNI